MQQLQMQLLDKKYACRDINDTSHMARLVIGAWEGQNWIKEAHLVRVPALLFGLINKSLGICLNNDKITTHRTEHRSSAF